MTEQQRVTRIARADFPGADRILVPEAAAFVADLHREFEKRRLELLARRTERRQQITKTGQLDFLAETKQIRESAWTVARAPRDLLDRRVEITGPTDRKMTINALNSGARVWLADHEDANSPTWHNMMVGHVNLVDAIEREITFEGPDGRKYELHDGPLPTIIFRPRGWHLPERHVIVDGTPVAGGLFDFGLYFFHNARRLLAHGSGPYFYLPKLESHLEARLWNDVFEYAQEWLELPSGTVRATVLIETITAAFEMDEILWELRDHVSGLNAGRWDYLFSVIKTFPSLSNLATVQEGVGAEGTGQATRQGVLPDRSAVTMTAPFMRAYTELLVATCHRRGAFAMGGMAAFIPSRRDPEANERALAAVLADKEREAGDGFDGSWVAHPDLVPVCLEAFDSVLDDRPNQLDVQRHDVTVGTADLLDMASTPGAVTGAGLRANISVGLRYLESWLRGIGAAAIDNLMEDVATAEIARSQVWQWVHQGVELADGTRVTPELARELMRDVLDQIANDLGATAFAPGRWADAEQVFERVALSPDFVEFLTFPAYDRLT
jgi:malate synthase